MRTEPLTDPFHVAAGVDVREKTLLLIFEACVSKSKHRVRLDELNLIVSHLGSRIAQLQTLTAEQRLLAEPALYSEIVARLL